MGKAENESDGIEASSIRVKTQTANRVQEKVFQQGFYAGFLETFISNPDNIRSLSRFYLDGKQVPHQLFFNSGFFYLDPPGWAAEAVCNPDQNPLRKKVGDFNDPESLIEIIKNFEQSEKYDFNQAELLTFKGFVNLSNNLILPDQAKELLTDPCSQDEADFTSFKEGSRVYKTDQKINNYSAKVTQLKINVALTDLFYRYIKTNQAVDISQIFKDSYEKLIKDSDLGMVTKYNGNGDRHGTKSGIGIAFAIDLRSPAEIGKTSARKRSFDNQEWLEKFQKKQEAFYKKGAGKAKLLKGLRNVNETKKILINSPFGIFEEALAEQLEINGPNDLTTLDAQIGSQFFKQLEADCAFKFYNPVGVQFLRKRFADILGQELAEATK